MSMSVVSTRVLLEELVKMGFDINPFLNEINLTMRDVQTQNRIDASKAFFLWQKAIEFTRDPLFHFKIEEKVPFGAFRALELAMISSRTLGDGMGIISRYFSLVNDQVEFLIDSSSDPVLIEIKSKNSLVEIPPMYMEMIAAAFAVRFKNKAFGGSQCDGVRFIHEALGPLSFYEHFFGCPVTFESKKFQLLLSRKKWDSPMMFPDDSLLRSLISHLQEEGQNISGPNPDLINQIQKFLVSELSRYEVKIEDVAKHLGYSVRSLQRYLKDRDTSFTHVLDATRETLAKKYLLDEKISIAEISFLLGFAEQSTFQRAFRRWAKTSPLQWRKQALAQKNAKSV